MHLAAALGKPGIALFGPTNDKVWGPWHSHLAVLRTECRCLHQTRRCPQGPESQCLADLSAQFVLEKLVQILKIS
jgi:ADP-heptose:LPS heptosyltransferase